MPFIIGFILIYIAKQLFINHPKNGNNHFKSLAGTDADLANWSAFFLLSSIGAIFIIPFFAGLFGIVTFFSLLVFGSMVVKTDFFKGISGEYEEELDNYSDRVLEQLKLQKEQKRRVWSTQQDNTTLEYDTYEEEEHKSSIAPPPPLKAALKRPSLRELNAKLKESGTEEIQELAATLSTLKEKKKQEIKSMDYFDLETNMKELDTFRKRQQAAAPPALPTPEPVQPAIIEEASYEELTPQKPLTPEIPSLEQARMSIESMPSLEELRSQTTVSKIEAFREIEQPSVSEEYKPPTLEIEAPTTTEIDDTFEPTLDNPTEEEPQKETGYMQSPDYSLGIPDNYDSVIPD